MSVLSRRFGGRPVERWMKAMVLDDEGVLAQKLRVR